MIGSPVRTFNWNHLILASLVVIFSQNHAEGRSNTLDARIKKLNALATSKSTEDEKHPEEAAAGKRIRYNPNRPKNIAEDDRSEDAGDRDEVRPDGSKGGNLKRAPVNQGGASTQIRKPVAAPTLAPASNNSGPAKPAKPGYAEPAIVFPSNR
jgi:hypothetical protein